MSRRRSVSYTHLDVYKRQTYEYAENYYIILIHAMYDVPGRSSDNLEMFDASDEVYEYLVCSICPVSLSKAGLSYNAESNCIQDRIRDWVVDMPDKEMCIRDRYRCPAMHQ